MIGCPGEGRESDLSRRGGDQPANGGEILADSGVESVKSIFSGSW